MFEESEVNERPAAGSDEAVDSAGVVAADAHVAAADADAPAAEPARSVKAARPGDPLVQALTVVILSILALALVTIAYALVTGVFGTGAPRTITEQRVVAAAAKIEAGSKDPLDWMAYILALTDDGQYAKAKEWIEKGKATLEDQAISADMLYMEADLYLAQGDLDKALETADLALKTIRETYESEKIASEASGRTSRAVAFGISENYWELLLLKAEVFETQERWAEALACYDEYLADHTTAATVYTQRGMVKEQIGDTAGAETDYRRTLAFISDDAGALAGLERIGVDR